MKFALSADRLTVLAMTRLATLALVALLATGCSERSPTQPNAVDLAEGTGRALATPVLDPAVAFFNVSTGDLGEPVVSEVGSVQPFADFSESASSSFGTSRFSVKLEDAVAAQVLSATHIADIDNGANTSGASVRILFDVLEEVTYEFVGGISGAYEGSPTENVQFLTSIQFNELGPFGVLFFEGDNSINTTPVDFDIDGVNDGNVGGVPVEGSRTGVLQPGQYELSGLSIVFSHGGGFSADARTDISLRLTPTDPSARIQGLVDAVSDLELNRGLNSGRRTALSQRLRRAMQQLARGRERVAVVQLRAFVWRVEQYVEKGILTVSQGLPLIEVGEDLIADLES